MHLTPSARRLLRDATERLRCEPVVEKPRGRAVDEIVAWLDEQHLDPGPRLSHACLRFDRELLAQVDEALMLAGEAPLAVNLGGMSSLEQARHGNREEKGGREKPRAHRVLASLPAGAPRPGIAGDAREVLDLDRRRLDLAAFDALVQVENLDSFYALPGELPALARWARPLLLYRGDSHYGVGLALESGASHLLLPPLAYIRRRANGEHQPPGQQDYQPALREHAAGLAEDRPLAGYLQVLLGEQRGLRQQWFGELAALAPVPLS